MSLPFPNIYHLRTVAEASSKACYVCLKPSVKVLITPDSKDFFYVCPSHLTDRGFASPIVDAEAEAAKKKEEVLDKEIEKVKQEYEEKQRKKGKKKSKDDDKDKKKDDQDDDEAEKERDDKIKALQSGANAGEKAADIQRVYALHKNFYQMRIDRIRNMEAAKRSQQRIKDPSFFPATPKGDIA
ncbi:VPS4-associated protein 1 [Exophiala viscosa]|uniref:VPS4-associated protein 1 n=1 Tax=Exophiala viscosa TaxID=2486360 RepID=A0AAN6E457_9EURO|nr:VPS4-associated protein 1 [Exophiala viscosa]